MFLGMIRVQPGKTFSKCKSGVNLDFRRYKFSETLIKNPLERLNFSSPATMVLAWSERKLTRLSYICACKRKERWVRFYLLQVKLEVKLEKCVFQKDFQSEVEPGCLGKVFFEVWNTRSRENIASKQLLKCGISKSAAGKGVQQSFSKWSKDHICNLPYTTYNHLTRSPHSAWQLRERWCACVRITVVPLQKLS